MTPDNARSTLVPRGALVLPAQPTSLVGRGPEVEALRDRLLDEGVRLLTLTGTAGTGKTRLALAVAAASSEAFPHGVWFVDLAPVGDPAGVLPAVTRALGVRAASDQPLDDSLRLYLREKRLLLVLDNFEHVLPAAPAVAALLDACPELQVLATSREPLRVRWERLYPVPPLRLPAPEAQPAPAALLDVPAMELFVQRARDVHPDFVLSRENAPAVAELCRRLDGLPLGIELAAARSRALPPQAILARLEHRLDLLVGGRRDEPARHQTVRAALAWSHDLLSPAEQVLFRRLGVFVGGCTPEAADAVCTFGAGDGESEIGDGEQLFATSPFPNPQPPTPVFDGLESLLAKSLLKQEEVTGEPRFAMLETIRAYALEALDRSGEVDVTRQRHAAYYAGLVEAAEAELRGPDQMAWLAHLDRDLANVRAALEWLARRAGAGDAAAAEQGLRMGGALWWYWHVRGYYAEARELLAPLLEAPSVDRAGAGRARALKAAGVAAWGLGDYATARAEVEDSLVLMRALGDRPGAAQASIDLGCVAISEGDSAGASAASAEALALARELGDGWMSAWALTFQGMLAIAQGDLPAAEARFEESLVIRRRLGDTFGIAWSGHGLASVDRLRGDAAAARPLYEECLATFRALGERPTVASVLDGLGEVAIAQGDFAAARERFGESLALYREMGSTRGVGIALSGFAALAAAEWRAERAVRLAGAATALHEAGGGAIELIRHRGSEDWLDEARRALGEEGAAAAWAAGCAMPPGEAIAYALAADTAPPRGPQSRADSVEARSAGTAPL